MSEEDTPDPLGVRLLVNVHTCLYSCFPLWKDISSDGCGSVTFHEEVEGVRLECNDLVYKSSERSFD